MISDQYYVKASVVGNFAACTYFVLNDDGSYTQVHSPLTIPSSSTACNFLQHPDSELVLQAAVFKTLPVSTDFSMGNYTAINGDTVAVTMPTTKTVTKGVVLTFSSVDGSQLYSSSDPQVNNNGD